MGSNQFNPVQIGSNQLKHSPRKTPSVPPLLLGFTIISILALTLKWFDQHLPLTQSWNKISDSTAIPSAAILEHYSHFWNILYHSRTLLDPIDYL